MKKNSHQLILWILIISFMLIHMVQNVAAHPHAFIAQSMKIEFDNKGLAGFQIYWSFDEMFSSLICDDFDINHDKKLDAKEVQQIKEGAFAYISKDNYYINIKIDQVPFKIKFVSKFNAHLKDGILSYEFFVPCHVTAAKVPKKIILAPYDLNYYSAIYFPDKNPWIIENPGPFKIDANIKLDKSTSIYYDMVNPWALFLTFSKK